jgi:hypothetical protein
MGYEVGAPQRTHKQQELRDARGALRVRRASEAPGADEGRVEADVYKKHADGNVGGRPHQVLRLQRLRSRGQTQLSRFDLKYAGGDACECPHHVLRLQCLRAGGAAEHINDDTSLTFESSHSSLLVMMRMQR